MDRRVGSLLLLLGAGGAVGWYLQRDLPEPEPSVTLPDEGLTLMGGCLGDPAGHGMDPATGAKRDPYAPNRAPEPPAWVRRLGPYGASPERARFVRWVSERALRLLDYVAWIALKEQALARSPQEVFDRTRALFVGASPELDAAAGYLACELDAEHHGPRFLAGVLGLLSRIDGRPARATLRAFVAREDAPREARRLAAGVLLALRPRLAEDAAATLALLDGDDVGDLPGLRDLIAGLRNLPEGMVRPRLARLAALTPEELGPDGCVERLRLFVAVAPDDAQTLRLVTAAVDDAHLAVRREADRAIAAMVEDPDGRRAWLQYLRQAPLAGRLAFADATLRRDPAAAKELTEHVLPALVDDDPALRDRAAVLLARMGATTEQVMPRVEGLVASGDPSRWQTAARALTAVAEQDPESERVFALVEKVARVRDARARAGAIEALGHLPDGRRSRALIADLLRDDAKVVRFEAVELLAARIDGGDEDPDLFELVRSAARDDDAEIRARVREILDEQNDDEDDR